MSEEQKIKDVNITFFHFLDNFSVGVKDGYTFFRDNNTGAVFLIVEFAFDHDNGKCEVAYNPSNAIANQMDTDEKNQIMDRLAAALLQNAVNRAEEIMREMQDNEQAQEDPIA